MTFIKTTLLLSTLLLTFMPFSAQAEESMKMDHSKMNHAASTPKDVYAESMAKMHEDMMAVKPTGDADVDFVQGMIPHHQGAVDMANVVLEKGRDPEIRKLAEDIIKAQESEMKLMHSWLDAHKK